MLEDALCACPEQRWRDRIWVEPTDAAEYGEFWFIVYHTLFWLDLYLSGSREGFAPPAPFVAGRLPEKPYTQADLHAYLQQCRQRCQAPLAGLSEEKANQVCHFLWGDEVSFAELQLSNMRHVQEHAAQLSLMLGRGDETGLDWVARAKSRAS
jgi:hypothetical protein